MTNEEYMHEFAYADSIADHFHLKRGGDLMYVHHELAHFALLFGRAPRRRSDWDKMQRRLDRMTPGRSQVNECRTMGLQMSVQVGFDLAKAADQAWYAIQDAESDVVKSKEDMMLRILAHVPGRRAKSSLAKMLGAVPSSPALPG